jgi:prepilin peptidase CpaA
VLVHGLFLALLAAAAVADLLWYRIPNLVTGALTLLFVVAALPQALAQPWLAHLAVGGAALVVGFALFSFGAMGGGDVKLLAATALWMGPGLILPHLVLMALLGLGLMLVLLGCRYGLKGLRRLAPERVGRLALPAVLEPGRAVPYGVAIAASAAWLSLRGDGAMWALAG